MVYTAEMIKELYMPTASLEKDSLKKPLKLCDLYPHTIIDKAIIESIEQALFYLELEINKQRFYVLDADNKILSRRSIIDMQALLKPYHVMAMYLRHRSPYDEMIGQEPSGHSNEMLLPLGDYFAGESSPNKH